MIENILVVCVGNICGSFMKGGKTINHSTILIAVTLMLQGCAMAPGMKSQNTENDTVENGTVIRVTSMTTDQLNQMQLQRNAQARQVASEFSAPRRSYSSYEMGRGDVLQVIAWDHRELTIPAGSYRDPESSGQQADKAFGLLLAERFEMQAQDVVFVDTAGMSKWNRSSASCRLLYRLSESSTMSRINRNYFSNALRQPQREYDCG